MRWEFIVGLFVMYVMLEVGENLLKYNWLPKCVGVSQFALLLISIIYLFNYTIFPRNLLFFPTWLMGILIGHLLYTLGLILTSWNLQMVSHLISFLNILKFCFLSPLILSRTFTGAVIEEVIYRGFFQAILADYFKSYLIGILIVAIGFSLVHKHIFKSSLLQSVEFFVFSIVLGVLYYFTYDLGLVTMVHFWRNMSTNYLDYLEKIEENRDSEQAISEFEKQISFLGVRDTR